MKTIKAFLIGLALASAVGLVAQQGLPSVPGAPAIVVPGFGGVAPVGSGGVQGTLGGTLFTSTTATATTGLVEETLASYTLPANTLAVNNRGLRITAWGRYASNGNSKTPKLYFGGTAFLGVGTVTSSNTAWEFDAIILRTGAATQIAKTYYHDAVSANHWDETHLPTETLSGSVLIKVTGTTPTTIGDMTFLGMLVEAI